MALELVAEPDVNDQREGGIGQIGSSRPICLGWDFPFPFAFRLSLFLCLAPGLVPMRNTKSIKPFSGNRYCLAYPRTPWLGAIIIHGYRNIMPRTKRAQAGFASMWHQATG